MAATVTATGTIGPGVALTAQVYTNVSKFAIDCVSNLLEMTINGLQRSISITSAGTITATKSGSVYTLTIS